MLRKALAIGISLAVLSLTAASGVHASESQDTVYKLKIGAQPIDEALNEFARQSGLQVVLQTEEVRGITAPRLEGSFTARDALGRLLENSGLKFEYLNDRTIAVRQKGAVDRKVSASGEYAGDSANLMHLARAASGEGATGRVEDSVQLAESAAQRDSGQDIKEIIVTAQKRAERLIDVPISIVAVGAEELQKRKITSLDDLSFVVPGLSIQSSGSAQRRIMLRGISNVFGNSSLIGMYMDEASVTSVPYSQLDLRTYDLERVEVLRGPQGTLYGEGSVGGTIRFITRNPELDHFGMKADMAALFTQDGAPGQRIEGALNIPVVTDRFGLRVTGTFDHQGGWIDQPAANRQDYNDQNLADIRVKGLWRVTPQFTVNAMALVHRNDSPPPTGEDADGNYVQNFNLTTTPTARDDYEVYNLTMAYDFSSVRLLSTSSYLNQSKDQRNAGFRCCRNVLPFFNSLILAGPADVQNFTEELRLTTTGESAWQWTLGTYYRKFENKSSGGYIFALPIAPGDPLPAPNAYSSMAESESWAVFGDTSYQLTNRLTVGAGLRYFHDDQVASSGFAVGALYPVPPLGAEQKGGFHATNPRAYLQYKLGDNVNAYASGGKGFRSGGFNAAGQPPFGPESVWTYDLGLKAAGLGGRFDTELAVFYSDYTDYQIIGVREIQPGVLQNVTSNAGSAKIKGVELAMSWHPTRDWTLSVNGTYVTSEFYEIAATESSHEVGDPLDLFPEYSFTVSAERGFDWFGRQGFARLDYDQRGRSIFRNRNVNGPSPEYVSKSDLINLLNFNVGVQWSETLSFSVFGQNLLDDRGYLDPFSIERNASRGRPRTFGIGFGVSFD